MKEESKIKLLLVFLILICLFKWPYGVYMLIRVILCIGFGYLAYRANIDKKETSTIVFVGLVILFQPIFKIALGRTVWNIVDVVLAIGLLIDIFKPSKNSNKNNI